MFALCTQFIRPAIDDFMLISKQLQCANSNSQVSFGHSVTDDAAIDPLDTSNQTNEG